LNVDKRIATHGSRPVAGSSGLGEDANRVGL
jgi:hypothetical protein